MFPALPLNEMTVADKLAVMELLWDDLFFGHRKRCPRPLGTPRFWQSAKS